MYVKYWTQCRLRFPVTSS